MMQTVNVHLLLSIIGCFCGAQGQELRGVTICEGEGTVFTCVLNSNIRSDDVQWYRFINDTSTTVMVYPNGGNFNIINHTNESTTSSSLNITNAIKSYTGYFWVGTPSLTDCNRSLIVTTRPPALRVNIVNHIESLSIVVQWDAVDDFIDTTYTITWTDERGLLRVAIVEEQTSYTITGLTLNTVYTITISATNTCGQGPEFTTSVSLPTDITSTPPTISPTVTASTNPMTIISTASPSSTITSTAVASSSTVTPNTSSSSTTTIYNTATTTSTTFDANSVTTTTTTTTTTSTSTTTTATAAAAATTTTTTISSSSRSSSVTTTATVTSYNTGTIITFTGDGTSAMTTSTIYPSTTTVIRRIPTIVNTSSISTTTTTISTSSNIVSTSVNPGTTTTSIMVSSTPSTNDSSTATNESSGGSSNTGVIAGGVAGGLVVFFIFFIALYIFCIRKREKANDDSDELGNNKPHNVFSRCLICSNGSHTKDVPSVTNELALPHGEEHKPKDECKQEDKTDQQEEPCSPGGRRASKRHFYTHPRDSLGSILDDDDDDDEGELGSQKTPYLILSPIKAGQESETHVQCIFPHERADYSIPPPQANDEYSVPRRNTISSMSPRHTTTSDEYSVPRHNSLTGRPHQEDSNPHPCPANDQYSVPRQGEDQYSVPRQGDDQYSVPCQSVHIDDSRQIPLDDQYSIPRHSDDQYSVPRQGEDQYSVPRQGDDQYSVPRQSDDQYSAPCQSDDQYSVPHQSDDQYSVPRQSDDQYSVPRQNDDLYSVPRPSDDQYSVPRQNDDLYSVPRQSDDLYSVPRQNDDLYSVPRHIDDQYSVPSQNIMDDSIAPSDQWYATPHQSMMNDANPRQITIDDQCTVSRKNVVNNSGITHQSSGDDQYSIPRPSPHQNSVHDIPHHSPMNACTSTPDEGYAAPRQAMNSNGDQLEAEDEYALPQMNSQRNTVVIPHQVRNDEVYALPLPRVNNNPSITTTEDVYSLPSPTNVNIRDSKSGDDDGYGSLSVPPVNKNEYVNLKNKKKKEKAKYVNSVEMTRFQNLHKTKSKPGHR